MRRSYPVAYAKRTNWSETGPAQTTVTVKIQSPAVTVACVPGFPYFRIGPPAVATPAEKRGSPATPMSTTGSFGMPTAVTAGSIEVDKDGASFFFEAFNTATVPPPTAAPRAKKAARTRDEAGMTVQEIAELCDARLSGEEISNRHSTRHITQKAGPGKSPLRMRVRGQVFYIYINTVTRGKRVYEITSSCAAGNGG